MMMNALDPTFTLSSDFYYRSLLAKVFMIENGSLYPIPILCSFSTEMGSASVHVQTLSLCTDSQCQCQYFHSVADCS